MIVIDTAPQIKVILEKHNATLQGHKTRAKKHTKCGIEQLENSVRRMF